MSKRRNPGEGSLAKVKRGNITYWRKLITIGYDTNGKQIRKAFYAKTQKEVSEKYNEWKSKQSFNSNEKDTLSSRFKYWLFQVKKLEFKSSTFERYYGIYSNYILTNKKLSQTKLTDITTSQIQLYYNELIRDGKKTTSVKTINRYIRTFFEDCVKEGLIIRNPCNNIKFPKDHSVINNYNDSHQFISLGDIEQLSLAKKVKNDNLGLIILLGLCCGLRLGEILALQYQDFIFDKQESWINVYKSLKRVSLIDENEKRSYVYEITTPKTNNSIRKVPLPNFLIAKIKYINDQNTKNKQKYAELYCNSNLLFCREDGTPLDTKLPNRRLKSLAKELNLSTDIHFHTLRHIFISNCINANIPPKTVATWVGHSNINTTLNIYAKLSKEKLQESSNIVNNKFETIF